MRILDRFWLNGKKALVTGAGRGIGQALALAQAEAQAMIPNHYGKIINVASICGHVVWPEWQSIEPTGESQQRVIGCRPTTIGPMPVGPWPDGSVSIACE